MQAHPRPRRATQPRQADHHLEAAVRQRAGADAAAVGGRHRAHDREPEPHAAIGAGAVAAVPVERLEQRLDLVGRDHRAAVGHAELRDPPAGAGVDLDPALGAVVPHRVLHQVGDHPLEQGPVAGHRAGAEHLADPQIERFHLRAGVAERIGGGF
jgi:hypothetical protein